MKTAGWVVLTLIFLGASVLLAAWPDLRELRRGRLWNAAQIDAARASQNQTGGRRENP